MDRATVFRSALRFVVSTSVEKVAEDSPYVARWVIEQQFAAPRRIVQMEVLKKWLDNGKIERHALRQMKKEQKKLQGRQN